MRLITLKRARPYPWLPALILVMTVVALAIGGLILSYVEARLVATTGESLALAAAEVADKLDRLVFERHLDSEMLAQAFSQRSHEVQYLSGFLNWMKTAYPVYLWLSVTDARGVVIAATNPATLGQDYSTESWFKAARGGKAHLGDVEPYEAAGGVDSIAFTAPVLGQRGEFLGVVTTRVALPVLEDVVTRTIHPFQERAGFLGTVEYQFLTRTGEAFVDSDLAHKGNVNLKQMGLPSARLVDSGQPGYVEERHLRRPVDVVTGYARMEGYTGITSLGWGVLVRVDRSDILAPIYLVLWKLGVAGAVVWVPMFVVLLWTTGRLRSEWVQAQHESARARAADATLRESEERIRLIIETALDAVIVIDADGRITEWNNQAEASFGWSSQEVIGRPLSATIIPQQYRDAHERGLRRFLTTGEGPVLNKRIEITACHRDGREFPVELTISPAHHEGRYTFSAFVRDITGRKQAETRQAAQLAVSLVLAESATLADAGPKLLQAVCDTAGWELGAIWRIDRAATVLRCKTVWHAPTVNVEEFVTLSQQRTFTLGVGLPGRVWESSRPAWIPDVVKDRNFPRAPVAAKVGLHAAFGFPILVGREVLGVLEFFSHEIRQPDRDLLGMMADIGIKLGQFIERRELEEQLRQSQKMEAIGQLAGGIAHDFNNVLTVIGGYSQLLLERVGPNDPLRRELEEIRKAGDRAAALTRQMLAFSRRQVLEPKVLNLNAILTSIEEMVRRLIGEDIGMVIRQSQALGLVKADPGQIEQVIVNLAVNARDAMPQGGKLTIETSNVLFDAIHVSKQVTIPPGRYVMIAVTDTGHGIDVDTQTRIFEPFFTTKERGKGTGLGLATVYGIVKQSDGHIMVYSEPGRGATFKVYLPRVEEAAEPGAQSRVAAESLDGSETILVVEDEDSIRALACRVLQSHNYTVLEAAGAGLALRISQELAGPIHLLLTDVVMPQISGRELAERMACQRPEVKVLYMSGYTEDAVVRHGVLQEGIGFLQKPFTPDVLAQKVREVLDTHSKVSS